MTETSLKQTTINALRNENTLLKAALRIAIQIIDEDWDYTSPETISAWTKAKADLLEGSK